MIDHPLWQKITAWGARGKTTLGQHRLVLLLLLAGLLLLALPVGREDAEAESTETVAPAFDLAETEARLAQALSQIEGAGEVTVLLSLADGPRQILAQDIRQDVGRGETVETVVLSQGGGQETLVIQELSPRYQGAVLVCPGGDDPAVRLQLTEATSALTGLGADRISINKGK